MGLDIYMKGYYQVVFENFESSYTLILYIDLIFTLKP